MPGTDLDSTVVHRVVNSVQRSMEMDNLNVEIVRGYIEALNVNDFDHIWDYWDREGVFHVSEFVGLGISGIDTPNKRLIIKEVVPGGPVYGLLLAEDEIIRVTDGEKTWQTFTELMDGVWGQGIPGTSLTVTVRRGSQVINVPVIRGHVKGGTRKLSTMLDFWKTYGPTVWPDLKMEIQMIFAADDLVACYAVNRGVNADYQRAATWSECDIFRLRSGKIIECWGVEDSFSQMTQLGYEMREPQKQPAV